MSEFAERLKAINREVIRREENPDIEEWKRKQKQRIIDHIKDDVIEHFEWAASIGQLEEGFWSKREFTYWSEDISNIPNAEALTREFAEEIFKPYGIICEQVLLKRGGSKISITCRIE